MPDEVTFDAHHLELVVVELRYDARAPLFRDETDLLGEVDRAVRAGAGGGHGWSPMVGCLLR
jgi:hypothetical protein